MFSIMCNSNDMDDERSRVAEPDLHHLRQDLRSDLGHDLRHVLRQDLRPDLRQDLRQGLRMDLPQDLRSDLRHNLRHGLRHDLRQDLRPDLRRDLRHDLRHDLRRDLRKMSGTRRQPSIGRQSAPSNVDEVSEADAWESCIQRSEGAAVRRIVRVAGVRVSTPREPSPDYYGLGAAPKIPTARRIHTGVSIARQSPSRRSPDPESYRDPWTRPSRRH